MDRERFIKIPSLVVHPDSLILYSQLEYIDGHVPYRSYSHLKKSNRNHHKVLSTQAKRKLEKAIKYLIFLAHDKKVFNVKSRKSFSYRVGFITLTLSSPQVHPDSVITEKLLHQFLVEAKQKWKVGRYVWKAEYQRNGNIHYHILVDRYIPYIELRNCWNRIQEKLGYVSRARNLKVSGSPNSTDIHSLYNVRDVTAYITKYMGKCSNRHLVRISRKDYDLPRYDYGLICDVSGQKRFSSISEYYNEICPSIYQLSQERRHTRSVSANVLPFLRSMINRYRIWGCSTELSNISGYKSLFDNDVYNEVSLMRKDANVRIYDSDYYSVFYFKNGYISNKLYPVLFAYFQSYLKSSFVNSSQQLILEEFT